jgi:hypothetical protein
VIDRLRQLGYPVIEVPFGGTALSPRYENRKAEMAALVVEWLKSGGSLPKCDATERLVADMTSVRYDYANARGKFSVESKEDLRKRIGRSTDFFDALGLTFAMPVAPRQTGPRAMQRNRARTQDDPLSG